MSPVAASRKPPFIRMSKLDAFPISGRGRARQSGVVESCSDLKHSALGLDAGQVLITTDSTSPVQGMHYNPAFHLLSSIGVVRTGLSRCAQVVQVSEVSRAISGALEVRWAAAWQAESRHTRRAMRGGAIRAALQCLPTLMFLFT